MIDDNFSYQIGGSLGDSASSYVVRGTDRELAEALGLGEFCYVLNSRQMGKSSLRVRAMSQLQAAGTICLAIDLTGMGTQDLTPEKWYAGILRSLVSGCQLKFNWRNWWREKRDLLSPVQRLDLFIEEVLLVEVETKIVIFIDEIDRVLSQKFSLDDFFALIHSCYQKRQVNPAYNRLTFTLLGVAAPKDLIRDRNQSPFEIGKAIKLSGFTLLEAQPLLPGLTNTVDPQQTLAEILARTNGQPFLTQKLCKLVAEAETPSTADLVGDLVRQYIIDDWEVRDEPEHLRTIRDRLLYRNSAITIRLLGLYREILSSTSIPFNNSPEQIELRLSGLVVEKQGLLKVSNRIYAQIFDLVWIDEQLAKLRPYSQAIIQWLESDRHEAYLLQGQPLQDALTWSLNKSLADVDYQFLVASQNLAQQKVETTLNAVETASRLLADTRKKAQRLAAKKKLAKRKLNAISLGMTGLVLLLRYTGTLQAGEWNLLDRFFRWRINEAQEPRITVVTIGEADLKNIGEWPIGDRPLAQAIQNLQAKEPQAIGIDLYRDAATGKNSELLNLLKNDPNLYIVEKVVGDRVLAPAISDRQLGFSDRVIDSDGKVRRTLLSVVGDGQLRFSLGTKLALDYLQQTRGIELQPIDNNRYHLGKAVFRRFRGNDGGYVGADRGGYQILLNFWGTEANFSQYSLTKVINNEIDTEKIRDRLILIGMTAESLKDTFYTPYSQGRFDTPSKMPGVFLHANDASQIIGAAIERRPLLRTHNRLIESLIILFWATVGAYIVWRLHSLWSIAMVTVFASLIAIAISYLAFLYGWWLPLIPSLLALTATAATVITVNNRERDRFKFQYILAQLSQEAQPTVRKIALGYYKQSENSDRQKIIDRLKN